MSLFVRNLSLCRKDREKTSVAKKTGLIKAIMTISNFTIDAIIFYYDFVGFTNLKNASILKLSFIKSCMTKIHENLC